MTRLRREFDIPIPLRDVQEQWRRVQARRRAEVRFAPLDAARAAPFPAAPAARPVRAAASPAPRPDVVARVLVAVAPAAKALVERHLTGCPLDFAATLEAGERLLAANRYTDVLIGHLFAESHMFEFAAMVRARQPEARVICVKGAGPPYSAAQRAAIDLSVRQVGCECFVDLTTGEIPEHQSSVFDDLLSACRKNPPAL